MDSPTKEDVDSEGENRPPPIPEESELEKAIKSGYLKKKGEQRRNWKKRWFVLRPEKLSYYKNDKVQGINIRNMKY